MNLAPLPSLEHLKQSIQGLPGIGPKSAFRLALHLFQTSEKDVNSLINSIQAARSELQLCELCNGFEEKQKPCRQCHDPERDPEVICVVEDPIIPMMSEGKQAAPWLYYVTHGVISPLDGKYPEDLKLEGLWRRLPELKEIILAFSSSMEGETTATYMMDELKKKAPHIRLSKIAHGIPFGARLDGVDERTLSQALQYRQPV